MNTAAIVALTALGTVSVFTAGGVVTAQLIKQTAQPAAVVYDTQVTRSATSLGDTLGSIAKPVTAALVDDQPIEPRPVPERVAVVATKPQNTAEMVQDILEQPADEVAQDVVLYDFVSAEQSSSQFENAIPDRLAKLVIDELRRNQNAEDAEVLITAAADLGMIDAPAALSTSDGKADARAILLAIMSDHETATGERFELEAVEETVAIESPTRNQLYTVVAGDSLAYIPLIFYGSTEEYRVIFNANRSKIESPDSIQIGQRLIIPAI